MDSEIHLRLRGMAFPTDDYLRGITRFARRVGPQMPVLVPDNTGTLAADVNQGDTIITVDRVITALALRGTLLLGGSLHQVVDIDDDDATVTVEPAATEDHAAGTEFTTYGYPVVADQETTHPTVSLAIDSAVPVLPGDEIAFPMNDAGGFAVIAVIEVEETAPDNYTLTLASRTPRALLDGETLQLRTHPAYESRRFGLPDPRYVPLHGPYALDLPIAVYSDDEGTDVDPVVVVHRLNINELPIADPEVGNGQAMIPERTIRTDQLLYFERRVGELDWDGNYTRIGVNSANQFGLEHRFVPRVRVSGARASGGIAVTAGLPGLADNQTITLFGMTIETQATGAFVESPGTDAVVDLRNLPTVEAELHAARLLWAALVRAQNATGAALTVPTEPPTATPVVELYAADAGPTGNQPIGGTATWVTHFGLIGGTGAVGWRMVAELLDGANAEISLVLMMDDGTEVRDTTTLVTVGDRSSIAVTFGPERGSCRAIRILGHGDPGTVVQLEDVITDAAEAEVLQYSVVLRGATSRYNHAVSAMLIKPILPNLDYLRPVIGTATVGGGYALV